MHYTYISVHFFVQVDITDLVMESVPNIKVFVSIIGFKIKIRRSNKWVVIISNKFVKPISKSKWVVNRWMQVKVSYKINNNINIQNIPTIHFFPYKITMEKKEREFWGKCLVTETREHNTALFQHHNCTSECAAPIMKREILKLSSSKEECMRELTTFLKKVCINIKDVICVNL